MNLGIANSGWVRELAKALCDRQDVPCEGNFRVDAEFRAKKLLETHSYKAPVELNDEADNVLARWTAAETQRREVAHARQVAREEALAARLRANDPPEGYVFVVVNDEATGRRVRLVLPTESVQTIFS